ncbi:MAG: hypothetical protein ACYTXY_20485, partial [Nostoc sp.]
MDIYILNTYRQGTYSSYRLSEVQEPHPQPPKSKRGGGYDLPYVIRKCYISNKSKSDRFHP